MVILKIKINFAQNFLNEKYYEKYKYIVYIIILYFFLY